MCETRSTFLESRSAIAGQDTLGQRYQMIALLGRGGQSTVHVAMDCRTGQQVALKVVRASDRQVFEQHQRLMQEAFIGSRIVSEHLVRVFDAGWDERTGSSYLAMELLDGVDLQRLVEQAGPLAPGIAVEYLRQVAVGLDRAHGWANGFHRSTPIVHRDLKPANLYLTRRLDGSSLIKILDFGIAKVLRRDAVVSAHLSGTPLYMAPEQFLGAPVSVATDVWALGLIAHFLITGSSYWRAAQGARSNLNSLFAEASGGALEPPSRRWREAGLTICVGADFDAWFMRCVHRSPDRRYTSAGDAIAALGEALDPNSSPARLRLWFRNDVGRGPSVLRRRCLPGIERAFWQSVGAVCGFLAVVGGPFVIEWVSTSAVAAIRTVDAAASRSPRDVHADSQPLLRTPRSEVGCSSGTRQGQWVAYTKTDVYSGLSTSDRGADPRMHRQDYAQPR